MEQERRKKLLAWSKSALGNEVLIRAFLKRLHSQFLIIEIS
jgi:hypothetical protein